MSTFVDIEFDEGEKASENQLVENQLVENQLVEKKLKKSALRKQKNQSDDRKIASNISNILIDLVDFTETIKTFIEKDYMFKTDGMTCLDFIKNYSNFIDNVDNVFFLQNINTFSDFIKYIDDKLTTPEDKTKILHIKQSLEEIENTIKEKNRRKKMEEEEDEYYDEDEDDEDEEKNESKLPPPPPNRRIRINRQGSFVDFQQNSKSPTRSPPRSPPRSPRGNTSRSPPRIPPKSVSNIKGEENLRVTMKDITIILDEIYNSEESQQSTTLDILAIYLKGQKILYIEAKTHCEQHLNSLMLPAIFISSLCTLLSVVLKDFTFGPILVSSLMAINSFILAMISYLKLDAKAEAHKITAYKFEKLQSLCELRSGRTLFMKNENGEKSLVEFINKLDEQVREIKESNQFILPERIRYHYPLLYSTNVFSDIKKIYNEEMIQRTRLKNLINRIKEEPQNFKLQTDRDRLLEQIIKCRDKYLQIDDIFNKEIAKQIIASKDQISCCNWLKT